jgi:hypothetical protein
MVSQSVSVYVSSDYGILQDFIWNVNQEVFSIKERQSLIVIQTSVNHFQEQLELSWINKGLIQ